MKNPFNKPHTAMLISAISAGAAISGGLAWLFLTDKGAQTLNGWQTSLKEKSKNIAANILTDKTGVSKSITKPMTDAVVD